MLAWSHRSIDRSGACGPYHCQQRPRAAPRSRCGIESMSPIVTFELADHHRRRRNPAAMPAWSRCTARAGRPRRRGYRDGQCRGPVGRFGPYATGHLKDATGTYHLRWLTVAASTCCRGGFVVATKKQARWPDSMRQRLRNHALHPSPATRVRPNTATIRTYRTTPSQRIATRQVPTATPALPSAATVTGGLR